MKYFFGAMLMLASFPSGAEEPKGTTKEQATAYENAVKQCRTLAAAEKQKCMDAAKEKHGEMLK
jgi:hypothetical protein